MKKIKVSYVYEHEIHKSYRNTSMIRSRIEFSVLINSEYVLYLKDDGICEIIKSRRNYHTIRDIIRNINDKISYLKETNNYLDIKRVDYMAYFKESFETEVRKLEVEDVRDNFYNHTFEFEIIK